MFNEGHLGIVALPIYCMCLNEDHWGLGALSIYYFERVKGEQNKKICFHIPNIKNLKALTTFAELALKKFS